MSGGGVQVCPAAAHAQCAVKPWRSGIHSAGSCAPAVCVCKGRVPCQIASTANLPTATRRCVLRAHLSLPSLSVSPLLLIPFARQYVGTEVTSEQFNTAGRSVKIGLTAAVIVSQWTWAATLLQSSNVAFGYGVSGPFWYAAGATIQVPEPSLVNAHVYAHN
jgi:hypothetical protein